ncbi:hypothetical protein HMPREF0043_01910 [Actinobaculum sp. oral taxon 183 str. F0552]|nr:hypothetical protein HMPREF0043_01910 [Actinobaculum sp. oral taxon 183 str. F0552]
MRRLPTVLCLASAPAGLSLMRHLGWNGRGRWRCGGSGGRFRHVRRRSLGARVLRSHTMRCGLGRRQPPFARSPLRRSHRRTQEMARGAFAIVASAIAEAPLPSHGRPH